MKLPAYRNRGVETLGRWDVSGPGRVWAAETRARQALAGEISNISQFVTKLDQERQKKEAMDRVYQYREKKRGTLDYLDKTPSYDLDDPAQREFLSGVEGNLDLSDGAGGTRSIVEKHEVYANVWDIQSRRIREDATKGLTPFQLEIFDRMTRDEDLSHDRIVARGQLTATNDALRQGVIDQIEELEAQGRWAEVPALVQDAEQFTQAERDKLVEASAKRNEEQALARAVEAGGEQAQVWIQVLEDPEYEGNLSRSERKGYIRDLKRGIIESVAFTKEATFLERERAKRDLTTGIANGTVGTNGIVQAREAGLISWQEELQLQGALARKTRAAQKKSQSVDALNEIVAGRMIINPYDTKSRNKLHKATESIDPRTEEGYATLVGLADQTGVLPKNLEWQLTQDILHGNEEQAASAIQTYVGLTDRNKYIHFDRKSPGMRVLNDTLAFHKTGMDLRSSVAEARRQAALSPEERRSLENAAKESLNTLDMETPAYLRQQLIDEEMVGDTMFFGMIGDEPPPIPPTMTGDFNRLYQEEFMRLGNADLARSSAWERLNSTWGVDNMSTGGQGPRLKRYPYERMYPGTQTQKEMALERFAEANGYVRENINLIASTTMARGEAEWSVYEYVDGEPVLRPEKFNPEAWAPQGEELLEAAKLQQRYDLRDATIEKLDELMGDEPHPIYDSKAEHAEWELRVQALQRQLETMYEDLDPQSRGPLADKAEEIDDRLTDESPFWERIKGAGAMSF